MGFTRILIQESNFSSRLRLWDVGSGSVRVSFSQVDGIYERLRGFYEPLSRIYERLWWFYERHSKYMSISPLNVHFYLAEEASLILLLDRSYLRHPVETNDEK